MLRGLYSATSGLTALLQKQEIETNNLVNSDTTGYKKQKTLFKEFKDVLLDEINYQEAKINKKNIGSLSRGVMVDDVITVFEQGTLVSTESELDFAIDGEGYFTLRDSEGKEYYTRDGAFKLNYEGVLVNNSGLEVLGEKGVLNLQGGQISVDKDGSVFQDGELRDKLKLVRLNEPVKVGGNLFLPSGEADSFDIALGSVEQGYLEQSNANVIEGMTRFIALTRSFESSQRIIQTYDSTIEKAVNEVGRV